MQRSMNRFGTHTFKARPPVLLIAVLVALLVGSQVLSSVMAADLDMQAAHQTYSHQAHAHHAAMDTAMDAAMEEARDAPQGSGGDCATGACCADSCSQVGLSGGGGLQFVPGEHRPTLRPALAAARQLGVIYRPPRPRV